MSINKSHHRAYSSCFMHTIVARMMRLPFLKIFSNFVHFCPNFQIFCPFLPFFAPFLKNRMHILIFLNRRCTVSEINSFFLLCSSSCTCSIKLNPLSANVTKWWNTPNHFVNKNHSQSFHPIISPANCLSVLDYFVGLALKGLLLILHRILKCYFVWYENCQGCLVVVINL